MVGAPLPLSRRKQAARFRSISLKLWVSNLSPLWRAVALAETGGGQIAVFAYRTSGSYGFKWTGSGGEIQGNVHSNHKVWFTGSNHHCTGWIEYRNGLDISGSGHQVDGGYRVGEVLPYPVNFTPADFQPYDYTINGDFKPNGRFPAGVYYVTGNVHLTSNDTPDGPVTFVAEGKISASISGSSFKAARRNVLFFTLTGAETWDLDVSGSNTNLEGICYAPNGDIQFSGSGHTIYKGCLIGQSVLVTGSDFTAYGTGGGSGKTQCRLVR
jgi:hypothetical protein